MDEYYKGNEHWKSVYYVWELDKVKLQNNDFCVIAIDALPDDNIISHFVACYRHNNTLKYFNSYGIKPAFKILRWALSQGLTKVDYSTKIVQYKNTNRCGAWTLMILDKIIMNPNKSIDELILNIPRYESNNYKYLLSFFN